MIPGEAFKVGAEDMDIIAAYRGERRKSTDSIWWYAQRYCNSAFNVAQAAIKKAREESKDDKQGNEGI